ncbi:MAG: hypothetical protein NZ929_02925, partial [Aigarchaeota archaeon]|nr:hypothetical protein [Aigarchaeota archaeon]
DRLILTKAGATHYEVRLESTDTMLIYLEPDMWQGNSDVYPVTGGQRVGHHWSQFLMLSPGRWLTDRVESEGQFLIDFKIFKERGWMIIYAGRWGFRDYFITDAIHYIWIEDGILYRYVKTNLTVLKDIPDPVGAIWVELMNDPDYYMTAITNTREGLIVYNMSGVTGHALKEYVLNRYGWIALINPRLAEGSPALILVKSSSHLARMLKRRPPRLLTSNQVSPFSKLKNKDRDSGNAGKIIYTLLKIIRKLRSWENLIYYFYSNILPLKREYMYLADE